MNRSYNLLSKFKHYANEDSLYKDLSIDEILEKEYRYRINLPSAVMIDFKIVPFSRTKQRRLTKNSTELFYVILQEHMYLLQEVINHSKDIIKFNEKLPSIAKYKIGISQMVTEIKNNNDIEGVKSTRKEIMEAYEAISTKKKVRFKSSVEQYVSVLSSNKPNIKNLEDIRKLYDDVVFEEIDKRDYPDGRLFRKSFVGISNSVTGEYVHMGSEDEIEIENDLVKLIDFMNSNFAPDIFKAIISHYIFEYIHPFYDGNGRLGRYLLSSYLSYKLDSFSALSISESIKLNKKKYERAFVEVSNPINKGEITNFITEMLKIIIDGQIAMKEILIEANNKMNLAYKYIKESNFEKIEEIVIFIMLQHYLFSLEKDAITNLEIFENVKGKYSRYSVDKALKTLEKSGNVYKVSRNPVAYKLVTDKLPIFDWLEQFK